MPRCSINYQGRRFFSDPCAWKGKPPLRRCAWRPERRPRKGGLGKGNTHSYQPWICVCRFSVKKVTFAVVLETNPGKASKTNEDQPHLPPPSPSWWFSCGFQAPRLPSKKGTHVFLGWQGIKIDEMVFLSTSPGRATITNDDQPHFSLVGRHLLRPIIEVSFSEVVVETRSPSSALLPSCFFFFFFWGGGGGGFPY